MTRIKRGCIHIQQLLFASVLLLPFGCVDESPSSDQNMPSAGGNEATPAIPREAPTSTKPITCEDVGPAPELSVIGMGSGLSRASMGRCGHIFYANDDGGYLLDPTFAETREVSPPSARGFFSPSGKTLVHSVASDDGDTRNFVRIDLDTGDSSDSLQAYSFGFFSYPDGRDGFWFCRPTDEGGRLFTLDGDEEKAVAPNIQCRKGTSAAPNFRRRLVLSSEDGAVHSIDLVTGMVQRIPDLTHGDAPGDPSSAIMVSGDSRLLVHEKFKRVVDGDAISLERVGPARIYDLAKNTFLLELVGEPSLDEPVNFTTRDGSTVFVKTRAGVVAIRAEVGKTELNVDQVLHIFPDRNLVLGWVRDGNLLRIVDLDGRTIHELGNGSRGIVSPNGKYVSYLAGDIDCEEDDQVCRESTGYISIWSAEAGRVPLVPIQRLGAPILVTDKGDTLLGGLLYLNASGEQVSIAQKDTLAVVSADARLIQHWADTPRVRLGRSVGDIMFFEQFVKADGERSERVLRVNASDGTAETIAEGTLMTAISTDAAKQRVMFDVKQIDGDGQPVYRLWAGSL